MLKFGKQKIALCFSGQPRTWRKCISTWHNILIQNDRLDNVDVFCHVWDFNTKSNAIQHPKKNNNEVEMVNKEDIHDLLKILKPKKFLVESQRNFSPFRPNQPITTSSFLSQFYGIMKAARLKKEYEIENNLMYDVVVRVRYDSYFNTQVSNDFVLIKENTMHGFHFGWDFKTNRGRIGDIFWFADSQTYDIIADYYLNIHTINSDLVKSNRSDFVPENVFFHYIKKNNVNINLNHWNIQLFRRSAQEAYRKDKNGFETW
jgi:hypothetical protein